MEINEGETIKEKMVLLNEVVPDWLRQVEQIASVPDMYLVDVEDPTLSVNINEDGVVTINTTFYFRTPNSFEFKILNQDGNLTLLSIEELV